MRPDLHGQEMRAWALRIAYWGDRVKVIIASGRSTTGQFRDARWLSTGTLNNYSVGEAVNMKPGIGLALCSK